jgi:hypothetical protein
MKRWKCGDTTSPKIAGAITLAVAMHLIFPWHQRIKCRPGNNTGTTMRSLTSTLNTSFCAGRCRYSTLRGCCRQSGDFVREKEKQNCLWLLGRLRNSHWSHQVAPELAVSPQCPYFSLRLARQNWHSSVPFYRLQQTWTKFGTPVSPKQAHVR